jgi:hypothetical protein
MRRWLGNIGFWIANLLLAGFLLGPPDSVHPQVEAVLGAHLPSWPIAGAGLSFIAGLLLTYIWVSRPQHDRIVFGVRELPRRDCLKPSAMFLTPWRLGRAGVREVA